MKNIEYIYRKNDGHTINKEDQGHKINIKELLENKYSYINDSIKENNYNIRLNECDQFRELIYNQKVVGFVTYNKLNKSTKLLTNIYIINGYRRNHLFTEEIKRQYQQSQKINIYEPNKLLIDVLIKQGYAKQLNKTLLISAINFTMQLSNAITNNNDLPEKHQNTNLYDTNICATLSFKIFTKNKYTVYYTKILEEDKKKCQNARNSMDEKYFDKIVKTIIEQDMEIQRWLYLLRHNLPKKQYNMEGLIGTTDNLPETLREKIKNNQLTNKEAKIIQNQVRLELRTNKIDKETIQLRLHYLIENIHNPIQTEASNHEEYCPYCYEEKPVYEHYCTTCGYKLFDINKIDDEEYVYKYLLDKKQSYKYSLTGKQEHKNHIEEKYRVTLAACDIIGQVLQSTVGHEIFLTKAREYDIMHINLEEFMLKRQYITFNMNPEKWEIESNNYKKNELKKILKENNCKISGNKYELIQRIKEEVPLENIKSDIMEYTDKGIAFYNKNISLMNFNILLMDYIFDEYIDINNKKDVSDDILENFLDFLQKHVEMAHETKNHDQLVNALKVQSQIYTHQRKYNKFLKNEVKIIILNLNMYYVNPNYYSYYEPVTKLSWDIIYKFKNLFTNEEINDTIREVYDTFDRKTLKVDFYDMLEVFKDIFKHYSLTGLNSRIKRKYYKHAYNHIHDVKSSKLFNITTLDRYF